ncbi:MAG: hypothetical protein OEP52_05245 [Acidimicrobiia bacterium]|nr:hypothetical protein [Acidimicrobiia bacterium]
MKKLLLVIALVLAACGGGDSADPPADDPTTAATDTTVTSGTTAAPETAETQPPTTQGPDPSSGSVGIVLTIGDETWQFEGASCAFHGPNPGEEGSEWNVSFIKDGAQVYVSDDSFGRHVEYDDISNGGNPNFGWAAEGDGLSMSVDGNDITASGQFTDSVGGTGPIAGTLSATCPGWAEF